MEELRNLGYLHRDISINNIILVDETKEGKLKEFRERLDGFLIDYDYAIKIAREHISAFADRTVCFALDFIIHFADFVAQGTVPFMAIEVLKSQRNPKAHEFYHDLESIFYVLCWVCTVCGGPGKPRDFEKYRDSNVYSWNIQTPDEKGMNIVATSKVDFTQSDESLLDGMENSFDPYFYPIYDCLLRLRTCLFPPKNPEFIIEGTATQVRKLEVDIKQLEGDANSDRHAELKKEVKKMRPILPLNHKDRDRDGIFEDIYEAIDETIKALPKEHTLECLSPEQTISQSECLQFPRSVIWFLTTFRISQIPLVPTPLLRRTRVLSPSLRRIGTTIYKSH